VLERFSSAVLGAIADEVCLQGHLLARAYLLQVADRIGGTEAMAMGSKQLVGIAGVATKRLAAALGAQPDLDGIATVLAVHPMLLPRPYVDLRLGRDPSGDDALVVSIGPCASTDEDDGLTWPAILVHADDRGLATAIWCLAPRARIERVAAVDGAAASWRVTIDDAGDPIPQPDEVTLTEFSTGVDFAFTRRT